MTELDVIALIVLAFGAFVFWFYQQYHLQKTVMEIDELLEDR